MASVTADPSVAAQVSAQASPTATVRIEPPRTWLELRLHEVWSYRELLYFFIWRDLKVRYKQTVIGVAWVVLQPLLSMGVFTLFFGRLAKLPSDGLPYPVFYFAALAPWTYFSTALTTTTNVVVANQRVVTKVYFPRLILPLSSVLSGLVDFGIAFVVLVALVLGYGLRPGVHALWLPFLLLLALATALGVPGKWRWLYGLNPMAGVIEGFRWALTGHGQAPSELLLASAAAVAVLLVGGLLFFQRMEGTVADLV